MLKVMIVDDEYDIRQGLKIIIDRGDQGFRIVAEARDGTEAVELFERTRPDIVITDIRMPETDGLRLCERIRAISPETKLVILSGYNDFSYAQEAMKFGVACFLLKPVDPGELNRELASIKEQLAAELTEKLAERHRAEALREYLILKLAKGEQVSDELLLRDGVLSLGEIRQARSYGFLIVDIDRCGDMLLQRSGSDIRLLKFAARNIVEELLQEEDRGDLFEISDARIGILLKSAGSGFERQRLAGMADRMVECLLSFARIQAVAGVGKTVHSWTELPESYRSAENALHGSFFSSEHGVYFHDDINMSVDVWSFGWHDQDLLRAVKNKDMDAARREIAELLARFSRQAVPYSTIADVLKLVIVGISRLVLEENGDWEQLFAGKRGYAEDLLRLRDQAEIGRMLTEICEAVCSYLRQSEDRHGDPIDEILSYVRGHYTEAINLKQLSNLFYFNASYLGQLFKKETGEYFNDYVHALRIEQAKRMLKENGRSIQQVSERVGYKNINHFYIQFKKHVGVNPGDYD